MKRNFLFVVRVVVLSIVFVLVIASGIFRVPPSTRVLAALHEGTTTPYSNVIVVARSGGDFTSVQQALNSIQDNSPTNWYLVWVAPGTYSERVFMKPYVDIEGAGEGLTRISTTGSTNGVVTGASNAELRYLTVETLPSAPVFHPAIANVGASPSLSHVTAISDYSFGVGVLNTGRSSPTMADMTIKLTGPYSRGILNEGSSWPKLNNVTIAMSGIYSYGMYNIDANATIEHSNISVHSVSPVHNVSPSGADDDYGVWNNAISSNGYQVTIDHSTISASTATVAGSPSHVTRIGATKLEGGPVWPNGGKVYCAGVYDGNYVFYPNTCP